MGTRHNLRRDRQFMLISQLRRGKRVTLDGFVGFLQRHVPRLEANKKTIQRDVDDLRERLHAPIKYSRAARSYCLEDPTWNFPMMVEGESLVATLMCMRIASPLPPMPSLDSLQESVAAQLAAADPGDIETGMLDSIVHATTWAPALQPGICAIIESAWRERRPCHIRYAAMGQKVSIRTIEIHGVFLAEGAWYARAWCCEQNSARSFALHRIQQADLLPDPFIRRPQLVESISRGEVFDDTAVAGVTIRCSAEKAPLIREREWFPGQTIVSQPDGSIELHYATAPRQRIIWWVLSYAGALAVTEPAELRQDVAEIAWELYAGHGKEMKSW